MVRAFRLRSKSGYWRYWVSLSRTELHSGDWGYRMSGAAWGRVRVETEEGQGVTFFLTLLST